jgi:hypothetical protein
MMKLQIFVILVVGLFWGASFSSAQPQGEPCKCADRDTLLNALNVSQAAIQELNSQLEYWNTWEAAHGKAFYTDELDKALEESLEAVIGQVREGSGEEFGGYQVNSVDCSIKERSGQNWCTREIEKSLIDVYKEACRKTKNLPIDQNPYREVRQVVLHKISAYQAMQNFILSTLKSLPKTCRPNNWFGYVTYEKVQTENAVETMPKINGTLARNSKVTYSGTLLVKEGKAARAKAWATDSWDLNDIKSFTEICKGKQVARVMTSNSKNFFEGETIGNATFTLKIDFHPAIKTYDLYVDFFPINIAGQNSRSDRLSNAADCPEKGYDTNNNVSLTKRVQKEGHSVTGEKIDPDSPNYLEGRRVVKPEPLNQAGVKEGNTTTTTTHEIQFRWALWRLPAK